MKFCNIKELEGKIFNSVTRDESRENDAIKLENDKETYLLMHIQDCCESVTIEDIYGVLSWLENTPIVRAEEVYNDCEGGALSEYDDSYTWSSTNYGPLKEWWIYDFTERLTGIIQSRHSFAKLKKGK